MVEFSIDYRDPEGISKCSFCEDFKRFLTGCEPIFSVSTGVVYDKSE
jgi:hypothetical protein